MAQLANRTMQKMRHNIQCPTNNVIFNLTASHGMAWHGIARPILPRFQRHGDGRSQSRSQTRMPLNSPSSTTKSSLSLLLST